MNNNDMSGHLPNIWEEFGVVGNNFSGPLPASLSKVKFLNYSKTLKSSYLKTVDNWGDQSLTRAQQLHTMEQQLKTHAQELAEFKSGQNIH